MKRETVRIALIRAIKGQRVYERDSEIKKKKKNKDNNLTVRLSIKNKL